MDKSREYAGVISEAVRKGSALTITSKVFGVSGEDESYAHVVSNKSVYYFSAMKKDDNGTANRAYANVPIKDLEYIKCYTDFAQKAIFESKTNPAAETKKGSGYTLAFRMGKCSGLTAADILAKFGVDELKEQRKFLEANASKYPKNQEYINAIDEVLADYVIGNVGVSQSCQIVVYDSPVKYFKTTNEQGLNKVYQIKISCIPTEKAPYTIEIMNCFAPVKKMEDGTTPICMKEAVDTVHVRTSVTEGEWLNMLSSMTTTLSDYRQMIFKEMMEKDSQRTEKRN